MIHEELLIALHFLPNDDLINKDVIDHLNRNRADNHLLNFRWCSSTDINRNKSSYVGVQTIDKMTFMMMQWLLNIEYLMKVNIII